MAIRGKEILLPFRTQDLQGRYEPAFCMARLACSFKESEDKKNYLCSRDALCKRVDAGGYSRLILDTSLKIWRPSMIYFSGLFSSGV
jgi:hypothetical protein